MTGRTRLTSGTCKERLKSAQPATETQIATNPRRSDRP